MYKLNIIGAGSIGNHIAHAARTRGWAVTMSDIDPSALERTEKLIYPSRYGAWDREIVLKDSKLAIKDPADVFFVGTPPDSHLEISAEILSRSRPRILVIEKPLCGLNFSGLQKLIELSNAVGTQCLVGYNHRLGRNTLVTEKFLLEKRLGKILGISTRTREHWNGIFKAHPWLEGPSDSYLGFSDRGGGALGEHSHALNIWQHFANISGAGKVREVSAVLDLVKDHGLDYDRSAYVTLKTESGLIGDVIQDVITDPAEKSAKIIGERGVIEWGVSVRPGVDRVKLESLSAPNEEIYIEKTRKDDFLAEIDHVSDLLNGSIQTSPISLEQGIETQMIIYAAFYSNKLKKRVYIDWSKGFIDNAFTT